MNNNEEPIAEAGPEEQPNNEPDPEDEAEEAQETPGILPRLP